MAPLLYGSNLIDVAETSSGEIIEQNHNYSILLNELLRVFFFSLQELILFPVVDTLGFDLNVSYFICRFSKAVLVVPLDLLDFECCGDFLHPSGP